MSRATYPLKLPTSLKAAAERLAKEDGVSLNQWIATAVAHKVGAVETAADFFKRRAGRDGPQELRALLAQAPDRPPEPRDGIPADVAARLERLRAEPDTAGRGRDEATRGSRKPRR
jgi:hypothetical protein